MQPPFCLHIYLPYLFYCKKKKTKSTRCCECTTDLPHSHFEPSELRKEGDRACKECSRLPGYSIDGEPGPAEDELQDDDIASEEEEHDAGSVDSFEMFSERVRIDNSDEEDEVDVDVDEDDAAAAAEWKRHLPFTPGGSQSNIVSQRRSMNRKNKRDPSVNTSPDNYNEFTPGGYSSGARGGGGGGGGGRKKRKRKRDRGNSNWNQHERLDKWRRCDSICVFETKEGHCLDLLFFILLVSTPNPTPSRTHSSFQYILTCAIPTTRTFIYTYMYVYIFQWNRHICFFLSPKKGKKRMERNGLILQSRIQRKALPAFSFRSALIRQRIV